MTQLAEGMHCFSASVISLPSSRAASISSIVSDSSSAPFLDADYGMFNSQTDPFV